MRVRQAVCLGLGFLLQACAFECIYIYVKGHKACGRLEGPVMVVDRGGNMVELLDGGLPPSGCTCLPPELDPLAFTEPDDPALDELHAAIEADARVRCEELALEAAADPTPCETAQLDETQLFKSEETFESCKYLGATIDEDKDGYCPVPGADGSDEIDGDTDTAGTDTGSDTGTDTGSGDSPIVPDLPLELP